MSRAGVPEAALRAPRGAQGTVRRLIVYTLLLVLAVITATGVSGLLGRLLEGRPDVAGGAGGLALSLAFALVGGPLWALLWWFLWRQLAGPDRSSAAWGIYVWVLSIVALITAATSLLGMLAGLLRGDWSPDALAIGLTWLAVWVGHRLLWTHPRKGPLRFTTVPPVLGAAYGLVVSAVGAIDALRGVLGAAVLPDLATVGSPWWLSTLQSLVWAAGGALIWWWHWMRERAVALERTFASVVLVVTGVLGGSVVALAGLGTALHVVLRAAFDRAEPWIRLLDPLPLAVAAAAIGAVVWLYHRRLARERSASTRSAARLVEAGVGLVFAASGVGVIVNALLATLASPLAGTGPRSLLLAGLAALVVGAPVWWLAWRPLDVATTGAGATGRRVYLVAVFGASAVVALVALLVVGFRLFELALDDGSSEGPIERIRAPFGLLLATVLVAAYHFAIWRRDRRAAPPEQRTRAIDRVVLVATGDSAALARAIEAATGAAVVEWPRAETAEGPPTDAVLAALEGVVARRVLVLAGPGGRVEAVPLSG